MRCRWCDKTFESLAGLRQHQRRSHPVEYNLSNQAVAEAAPTTSFSNLELGDMAKEEAYEGANINMHLASLFQKKHEAIKYQRRKDSYKAMVARIKSDIEEAADDAPDEPPPPPDIDPDSDTKSTFSEAPEAIEAPETLHPPIPTPEPMPSPRSFTRRQPEPATLLEDTATNDYQAYLSSLLENEDYSVEEKHLLQSIVQQDNNIPGLIDALLQSLTTKYSQWDRKGDDPRRSVRTNRGKKYQGHPARGAHDFKVNQEDF